MISKFDRAESVTVTTAASATHLHSQLKSARLNYSTCAMDVNVKREYEPACTCGQYLEQFEVNVRTFGDSSSTFKFHEEATSIVLSGPAWAPWIHLPITSKLHLSLSQLILSVALSAYIGRRLVHLYLWRQLLGTPNLWSDLQSHWSVYSCNACSIDITNALLNQLESTCAQWLTSRPGPKYCQQASINTHRQYIFHKQSLLALHVDWFLRVWVTLRTSMYGIRLEFIIHLLTHVNIWATITKHNACTCNLNYGSNCSLWRKWLLVRASY